MAKITKRTVDALDPQERERVVWDDDLKGFGVRVHPSGRKVYFVKTRFRGRAVKVTIGPHGAVTPADARTRAAEIMSDARAGKDPAARGAANANAPTMRELGKRFLEEYVPSHCKPSTAGEYRRSVTLFIDPRIGRFRVPDIQRKDIAALHHGMRETPYQANRTLGVLSKMFNMAEVWGLRPDGSNPCRHVKRFREEKRERFLSDDEYRRLGETLKEVERDGSETPAAVAAIRLLMLTGCRLSEVQKLRWEHIDLNAGELRLPESKSGPKTVHLGDPAVAVLRGISRKDGNPWVIAGRKPDSHLTDLQHPWRRIRARAGLEDVRIHDLRHSFASGGLLVGEGLPMIGKLLGHTQVQTTARYAHLANDPVKSAANRIANRIAEVAG
ncbi:MAG: site-specific integrase [Rhodospirillaceae bacterium]|nr:site-specific integrase [Rhodospirillaceae bacterium]